MKNYLKIINMILFILLFTLNTGSPVVAESDENKPILKVISITDSSIQLSWDITDCNIDCNVNPWIYFNSWELYQKNTTEIKYNLVFETDLLSNTSVTLTGLDHRTGYYYYVKLFWDWSHLNPEIRQSYGKNITSDPIFIQTLNLGETSVFEIRFPFTDSLSSNQTTNLTVDLFSSMILAFIVNGVAIFFLYYYRQKHLKHYP